MSSRTLRAAVVAVAVAIGAYWYWSPFLAIHAMKGAAEKRDADSFNDHVDYPRLRESFKGQLSALMAEQVGRASLGGTDMERAGAGLGAMLGMALVDRLVDAFVRPEVVMRAMQEAKVTPKAEAGASEAKQDNIKWSYERKGVDKLIAYARNQEESEDKQVGLVFERSGFAAWKLTEIRLPALQ